MKTLVFRKAKIEDLKDIVHLLCDDELGKTRENQLESISINYLNAFKIIDNDPNQFLMVVEKNDAILGTCHLTLMASLTFHGALRMNIEAVRIATAFRGKKIGEWMLNQAFLLARKQGCKIIQLSTNLERQNAKRFYEKLGFKVTHAGMKIYL